MHMDRVQFSNDQNLYQEKCRLEVQIFTQNADGFEKHHQQSGQALWAVHGTEMLNTMVNLSFFYFIYFILIMCQYIIIICFMCVRDVVKPYKIHAKIIWEFIEALPDFLIWKASELKWNFQLHIGQLQICMFPCLVNP